MFFTFYPSLLEPLIAVTLGKWPADRLIEGDRITEGRSDRGNTVWFLSHAKQSDAKILRSQTLGEY